MSNKNQVVGAVLMIVFFLLGAITRQIYLVMGTEWLRGIPQFMAALSLLSLISFPRQKWWERKFWLDGFSFIWKIPFLLIYMSIVGFFIYFGIRAYLD